MLPNNFQFFNHPNTLLAQQAHLLLAAQAQANRAAMSSAGLPMVMPGGVAGMPLIPLPQAAAPTRPSPMLVPPGMAAEDHMLSESPDDWTEHKHTDGRVYYYNRITKQSSWVKPDILKTPQEKAATTVQPVWREYRADDGRAYFYNILTKRTTWTRPEGEEVIKAEPKSESATGTAAASSTSTTNVVVAAEKVVIEVKKEETEMEKAMKATLASMSSVPLPNERREEDTQANDEAELKKRQSERFRELLRDKYNEGKITTTCNWDQAVKWIQNDPRFRILNKVSEKKQLFNAWKVQRQKEERDEKRLAIKKAKEDLEKFLQEHPKMKETLKYNKACDVFAKEPLWTAVNDDDRLEIFRDCLEFVGKRDKDRREETRKRNNESLSQILQSMEQITYKTTWAQAQRLLIENPQFAEDTSLLHMDKEDALIVFEEHIKQAEKEREQEKEQEERRQKRKERKVREAFHVLLNELHKKGELTSVSLWSSLYPVISTDVRFDAMLMQQGSNALDLFKFFVEDLKEQYSEDRRKIKEILTEKNAVVEISTEYEQFADWVISHPNGSKVDHGNMKLCYNSMIEKAETKAKDEEREVSRKKRRVESEYRNLLKGHNVDGETEWEVIKPKIEKEKAFLAIEEEDREKLFHEYKGNTNECHHVHNSTPSEKSKKKKKEKKSKKSKKSDKDSESEGEIKEKDKKKKKKHSKEKEDNSEAEEKGKKSKKSRKRSRSPRSPRGHDDEKRRRYDSESD